MNPSQTTTAAPSGRQALPDDQQFVKGLGLTSSTALVIGSMIGSGIFIVSADIARMTNSPALLIAAWVVTGFMTITAALSYGELAAMMPHAGGQYVYLRESLGPLWGFLYGWTLFLVIQTGTIAAVGVGFGKFLGVFFPSISSTHWLIHLWKVPPIHIGPMILGNMDVGLNTQNLVGVLMILFLTVVNVFGVRTGAIIQNIFTISKVAALLGLVIFGLLLARNPAAVAANFHDFWRNAGVECTGVLADRHWRPARHDHDYRRRAGRIAVLRRRLEQRDLHRRGSEKSQPQPAAIAGDWEPAL